MFFYLSPQILIGQLLPNYLNIECIGFGNGTRGILEISIFGIFSFADFVKDVSFQYCNPENMF